MLIEVENLRKRYGRAASYVIDGVSFSIGQGETIGIMGESGSGKSTIGQILAGLYPATEGSIRFRGTQLKLPYKKDVRSKIQILFQHPEVSFNPRMKLKESLREPYLLKKRPYEESEFLNYMERFGIYQEHVGRYPAELSGGELQRMALARAMLMEPECLILDEPTSMLDMVSQAQMIRLLEQLQKETGVAYLFISHDRELCRKFCDRIHQLENGRFTGTWSRADETGLQQPEN